MQKQKGISTLVGVIIIIVVAIILFGSVFAYQYFAKSQTPITNNQPNSNVQNSNNDSNQVVCTQEAKQCLDGSYVGRVGPNCDFAPCPQNGVLQLSVWPEANTFDLNSKTFEGKDLNTNRTVKIVANNSTKIYRQSSDENGTMIKDYHDFQWFSSLNLIGLVGGVKIKGGLQTDGSILADEIFFTAQ